MAKQSSMAKQKKAEGAQGYEVRWIKTGDAPDAWRRLTVLPSLAEARAWRDQWRKSSNCADIVIVDTITGDFAS